MARSSGHNLSAFFAPRFGRPFIKRVVSRQRRRAGDEEARAQATIGRINTLAKEPTGFQWYEQDVAPNTTAAHAPGDGPERQD